ERTVGEAGQRIVRRLMVELLLEPAELLERLLELAILERDRRVVGERLEQLEILGLEGAQVVERVRDEQRADQRRLAEERRDQAPSDGGLARAVALFAGGRKLTEPAGALGHGPHEDRVLERWPHGLHDLDAVAGPDLAAKDLVALLAWQQADLGDVGA